MVELFRCSTKGKLKRVGGNRRYSSQRKRAPNSPSALSSSRQKAKNRVAIRSNLGYQVSNSQSKVRLRRTNQIEKNRAINNFELRFRKRPKQSETRLAFRSFALRIANGFSSLLRNHQGDSKSTPSLGRCPEHTVGDRTVTWAMLALSLYVHHLVL
jgi:hypothetical protein